MKTRREGSKGDGREKTISGGGDGGGRRLEGEEGRGEGRVERKRV